MKEKNKKESSWANFISISKVVVVIYALWHFQEYPLLLSLIIIFVILLDAVDGIVARSKYKKGEYGGFIDIFCDRAVELIILFTYAYWGLNFIFFPDNFCN